MVNDPRKTLREQLAEVQKAVAREHGERPQTPKSIGSGQDAPDTERDVPANWHINSPHLPEAKAQQPSIPVLPKEIRELKRKNARLQQEREILKKALAIFVPEKQ